ncbi:MAG TPA: ABC-F family ATP-binding cassette domain-containing protein [Bacteroidota bacterium]|nr:ABC-F family ATP-binding cassette domain-containing protein [Bacteroidota bacterium]
MLSLNNIELYFGERPLFDGVSCTINAHDRIGLVGSNGAGKSTLLKIITGLAAADSGSVNKAKYVTVGYLPQDGMAVEGKTLYKEAETAFEDVLLIEAEMEEARLRLGELDPAGDEYADTLDLFGELQHKLEDLDAFRMKSKIERVLMGLGFSVPDFERDTKEFSGGWQMRIALAKLLLTEPSLLLLDEPTNHLDLESLQWLEAYLRNYNGAVMLVSHDRAFLDGLTNKTLALRSGRLEDYAGNYSFYEKEYVLRKELLVNALKNQQQQLKQTEAFIERFRYKATKARQVQSRIKQMDKIELIEVEDEEAEIHFTFPEAQQPGRIVLELRQLEKRYGPLTVFSGIDYSIERGDRIAVVGVNGAGKSTLAKIAAGVESYDGGTRTLGYNVQMSYFAQHQADELDLSKEALQIVDDVAVGEIRTRLRTILGAFLFHGDDVFKKVKVLSGGEKSRLALAKMLLTPVNFLIMDEPTNHLDMRSKKVLQDALSDYSGTFLIVSHDRAFLDPIVNKVLEVRKDGVSVYLGNVTEYLDKKKKEAALVSDAQEGKKNRASGGESSKPAMSDKERKRLEAERRQQIYGMTKPLKKKLEIVEKKIEPLEQRQKEVEAVMAHADFFQYAERAKKITNEYKDIQSTLEKLYHEWEVLSAQIEKIASTVPLV